MKKNIFITTFIFVALITTLKVYAADSETPVNGYGYTNLFGATWYEPENTTTTTQSGYNYFSFNPHYLKDAYLISFSDRNSYHYICFAIPTQSIQNDIPLNFGYINRIINHYNGSTTVFINDDRNFIVPSDKQVLTPINVDGVEYLYFLWQMGKERYEYVISQSFPNFDNDCPYGIENIIRYMVQNNKKYVSSYDDTIPYFLNLKVNFKFDVVSVATDESRPTDTTVTTSLLKSIDVGLDNASLSDGTLFDFNKYSLEAVLDSEFNLYQNTIYFFDKKQKRLYSSVYTTSIRPFTGIFDVSSTNTHWTNTLKSNTTLLSSTFESNYEANFDNLIFRIRLVKDGKYGKWYTLVYNYQDRTALAKVQLPVGSSDSTLTQDTGILDVSGSASSQGGWNKGNGTFDTGTSTGGQLSNNGNGQADISDIVSFVQDVPSVISTVFSWLPPWVLSLLASCIAILISIAILKSIL